MEGKQKYGKPIMIAESFIPNEYIASCSIKLTGMGGSYYDYNPRVDLANFGVYDQGELVSIGGTFPAELTRYEILEGRNVYKWTQGNLPDYGISYSDRGFTLVGTKVVVINTYNPRSYKYYLYDSMDDLASKMQKLSS